jgi:hypothetical protein
MGRPGWSFVTFISWNKITPRPHFAVKNLFCNTHTIICTINGKLKVIHPKYAINTEKELLSTAIWAAKKGLD